jgi:lipopolysaccharide transport system ATP-binding protein
MALRLAFAVAAHLEPEVLLVDEVLAVGDAAFQRKCLGKMAEVARGGRTVIFVSHHLQAIQSLCERALLLRDGRLVAVGPTREVLNEYLGKDLKPMTDRGWSDADAPGNDVVRIRRARIVPETRDPAAVLSIKTAFRIEITLTLEPEECLFYVGLHFLNAQGERIFVTSSLPRTTERGTYTARCFVPGDLLNNGAYRTEAYFVRDGNRVLYKAEDLLVFEVADVPRDPGGFLGEIPGAVRPQLQWEVVQETP